MHRTWGGILAGALFVLPSLFILIALSWIYVHYGQTTLVTAIFYGIKPAVTAIVITAVIRISRRSIQNRALVILALLSFIAIFVFNLPFPLIILSAGIFGLWAGQRYPELFLKNRRHISVNRPSIMRTQSLMTIPHLRVMPVLVESD